MDEDNYEKSIVDIEGDADVKFNPESLLYLSLYNAIKARRLENVKEGFRMFRININDAETAARGLKLVDADYENSVNEFKKSEEYKGVSIDIAIDRLAGKKYELLMAAVGSFKPVTEPLRA